MTISRTPVGLYLHFPFCAKRCSYCDFATQIGTPATQARYLDALIKEMGFYAQDPLTVDTVYLGGGTPSLMGPEELRRVMQAVHTHFQLAPGTEISMECNPSSVTSDKLRAFRQLGINRISFGVQTFDETLLPTIDRLHTAGDAERAIQWAGEAGFEHLNLDLMYGLPGQTLSSWEATLDRALALPVDHLSMYALTVEEGTPMYRQVERGLRDVPDDERVVEMYHAANERAKKAGFGHYEIANWAKPGGECRHNIGYWTMKPYVGLGQGAHGFFQGERTAHSKQLAGYLAQIETGERLRGQTLEAADERSERAFLGLRLLHQGVPQAALEGFDLGPLLQAGQLERHGDRIVLSESQVPVANEVFVHFV